MSAPREQHKERLKTLLNPRHIAFVGGRQMGRCIEMCRSAGFTGDIYVVNPKYADIAGIACVQSLTDLPVVPDASFIGLSPAGSIEAIAELASLDAPGAVAHAAGFGELGEDFRHLEDDLVAAAGNTVVLGPNTMGLLNNFDGVALWGDKNHCERVAGNGVALISQSGAFLFGVINVEQAYPLGLGISIGNQVMVDIALAIEAALDDTRVGVIGLYIEGLRDGPGLGAALCRALEKDVPIVLLRGGGTPAAAIASASHTGTLAVPNDFWNALVDRYALIEVDTPKALIETTKMLAVCGVPDDPRTFFVTYSGGACTLIAEQAPARDIELTTITDANRAAVVDTLPPNIHITNPFDLNLPWRSHSKVSLQDAASISHCLSDLTRGETGCITMLLDVPRAGDGQDEPWLPSITAMVDVARQTGLPCIAAGLLPEGIPVAQRFELLDGGVAPMMGMGETLDAIASASRYRRQREVLTQTAFPQPLLAPANPVNPVMLDEAASKARLECAQLSMPSRWTGPPDQATAAATELGFPVAVKMLSSTVAHKAKAGGVVLNIIDGNAVQQALANIRTAIASTGITLESVLVERMVANPRFELIIGIKRHPSLGLALLVGRGGIEVEQHTCYALVLLPASDREVENALARIDPGLSKPARSRVLGAVRAVVEFALDNKHALEELDINPLIVTEDDTVVAVDALVVIADNDL